MQLDNLRIDEIIAVNSINYKKTFTLHRADRSNYALSWKISGTSRYRCGEREYISDRDHIVLLPKNIPYSFTCENNGPCIMIEFNADIEITEFSSLQIFNTSNAERLFTNILHLWSQKQPGYHLACLAVLYEIFAMIVAVKAIDYSIRKHQKRFIPVIEYIEEHYAEPDLNTKELSGIVSLGFTRFRKLFHECFFVSPCRYIENLRIEKAKNMLLGDFTSIGDIAEAVGYGSIYAFSRAFKKTTGLSPSEFIRNNRK